METRDTVLFLSEQKKLFRYSISDFCYAEIPWVAKLEEYREAFHLFKHCWLEQIKEKTRKPSTPHESYDHLH